MDPRNAAADGHDCRRGQYKSLGKHISRHAGPWNQQNTCLPFTNSVVGRRLLVAQGHPDQRRLESGRMCRPDGRSVGRTRDLGAIRGGNRGRLRPSVTREGRRVQRPERSSGRCKGPVSRPAMCAQVRRLAEPRGSLTSEICARSRLTYCDGATIERHRIGAVLGHRGQTTGTVMRTHLALCGRVGGDSCRGKPHVCIAQGSAAVRCWRPRSAGDVVVRILLASCTRNMPSSTRRCCWVPPATWAGTSYTCSCRARCVGRWLS